MLLRDLIFWLSTKKSFTRPIGRTGMRLGFAKRFIAGETLEDGLRVAAELNARGMQVNMNHLGEGVTDKKEAEAAFEAVRRQHPNPALAVQSYLYRTEKDLQRLQPLRPKIRLVKGAYREPPSVAFPKKSEVDENYRRLLRTLFSNGFVPAIATHDDKMIELAKLVAREAGAPPDRWEFQMILGVRRDLQEKLVREGYRMRVYIPFGTEWLSYFMRRLAERPANVGFVLKSLLKGG